MGVKVKSDFSGAFKKVKSKTERTQAALDEQILKDSNFYAPQDQSELINSSLIASKIGEGELIWDTPYARRLYWNPDFNFSTDVNTEARGKWFEYAKSQHLEDWLAIAKAEVDK